jgi:recombinational DNA repair ATPase RecF
MDSAPDVTAPRGAASPARRRQAETQPSGAAMIKAIHFKNYKALRDTTLPLGRLTLLIGPNGSGESTALGAIRLWAPQLGASSLTAGLAVEEATVAVRIEWGGANDGKTVKQQWRHEQGVTFNRLDAHGHGLSGPEVNELTAMAHASR